MFGFLATAFNTILYIPLFNVLVWLYTHVGGDFGIAIILLTILIRILLSPVFVKSIKSQRLLQTLQPKVQEIQERHKDDKEKQTLEILQLYKQEKINPFSSLFLALIQLPVLLALYRVFWQGLNPGELAKLYPFVSNPIHIDALFLGLIDLSKPFIWFAILAGAMQFFQTKMLLEKQLQKPAQKKEVSQMIQTQMTYIFPVVTVIVLFNLPSALALYWIVSGIFSVAQQYLVLKKMPLPQK